MHDDTHAWPILFSFACQALVPAAQNKTTDAENVNKDMSQERANQENYRADAHAVMQ
jgi:fructose-bisphosphate aldolase class 1